MQTEVMDVDTPMTDVVFDLEGTSVPEEYPFELWSEISGLLPWLKDIKNAGILPLRGSASGNRTLLSRRTKLILRVPQTRVTDTLKLAGQKINIDGNTLVVGKGKERELQAATTLHAYMVESSLGEVEFLNDMKKQLESMNVSCNLICDKYRQIKAEKQSLSGFGLVLHDLKPQPSLQMQRTGLGLARQFGCGIFVPFKAITGLE